MAGVLTILLVSFFTLWNSVNAYKSGFTTESCDNMVPVKEAEATTVQGGTVKASTASSGGTTAGKTDAATVSTQAVSKTSENSPATSSDAPESATTKAEKTTAPESATTKAEKTTAPESATTKAEKTTAPESATTKADEVTTAPQEAATSREAPESATTKGEEGTTAPEGEAPTETATETGGDDNPADGSTEAPSEESSNHSADDNAPENPSDPPGEDGATEKGESEAEPSQEDSEEPAPDKAELFKAALESSDEASPFKIELSSTIYRRKRPIKITLTGDKFHGMMLQVRKESKRFGAFTKMPDFIKAVQCDPKRSSAVTNKDAKVKANVSVTWIAPDSDCGPLVATATFVKDEKYWLMVKSEPMIFSEFPTNLDICGKEKSCVRLGSADCDDDSCRYILTYQLSKDNTSVEFVLGGTVQVNGYIGVAFVENSKPMTTMDTTACLRTSMDKAEIRHYIFGPNDTLKPSTVQPQDLKWEIVAKDRLWCKFSLPITSSQKGDIKFTQPLYQVYLQGELKASNTSDNEPMVPMTGDHVLSKKAVSFSDIVDQRLPSSAATPTFTAFLLLATTLLFLIT